MSLAGFGVIVTIDIKSLGMSVRNCLVWVMEMGRPILGVGSTPP